MRDCKVSVINQRRRYTKEVLSEPNKVPGNGPICRANNSQLKLLMAKLSFAD